jgi:branched-chain amino acid transport system substrate-binding protein
VRKAIWAAGAVGLVLTLALAGCSSSSKSSSGSSSAATGASPTGKTATGTPIKFLSLQASSPATTYKEHTEGIAAAVKAVNAAGGINGHPMQVDVCETSNANDEAACARKVSDAGYIATVFDATSYGSADAIEEAAGIAKIGVHMYSTSDLNSPMSFPFEAGGLGTVGGQTALLTDSLKATKIGIGYLDNPAASALPPLIDAGVLAPRGLGLDKKVSVPLTAADLSSQVSAMNGTDGIVLALSEQYTVQFIKTARQQAVTTPIAVPVAVLSQSVVNKELSGSTEDLYGVSPLNHDSKGYTDCLSEIKQYEGNASPDDEECTAWMAAHATADIVSKMTTPITRANVLKTMQTLSGYSYEAITAPISFN